MKSKTGWVLAIGLGLIVLFFLPSLLMGRFWQGGYSGMMGNGMMVGFGFTNPFGFFGMALMWLISLAIIALVVLGVVSLFNGLNNTNRLNPGAVTPARTCQNCGKTAQADWATCPYCGKSL